MTFTLAELADISVGDAWLERFEGSDGVNDLVVRSAGGERLLTALAGRLVLQEATPDEIVASPLNLGSGTVTGTLT